MKFTTVTKAEDVSTEVLLAATEIYRGWFADSVRIDWEDFLDRLDGIPLDDGSQLDLGTDLSSPAIVLIRKHIKAVHKSNREQ